MARTTTDSAKLTHPVKLAPPRPALPADGPLVVDSASATPRADFALRADEPVRVAVRAPSNASVWVQLPVRALAGAAAEARNSPYARRPLVNAAAGSPPPGISTPGDAGAVPQRREPAPPAAAAAAAADSASRVAAAAALAADSAIPAGQGAANVGALFTTELPAALFVDRPQLVVARGADTVRIPLASNVPAPDPALPRGYALLGGPPDPARDSDRVIVGRPVPGGTYKWFLLPGTVVETTGRSAGATRVRLDQSLEIWVDDADVVPLPAGYAPPRRVAGGARVVPAAGWVDFVLPLAERTPYLLTQDDSSLRLTLYGTSFSPDIIPILANDTLVRQIVWEQVATDRATIELRLAQPAFGYRMLWDAARGAMVLRVRRPPRVDRVRPLAGLTIVVDAGHPPGGATGPTGLLEPVAVLPVAERVRALLEARGAHVVMTRTTADPVALADRPAIARRADADAFVSIHLNAFPDGVNPFANSGTSTLFYNQSSEPLARLVQRALTARLGLRDLGVHYQNLAVARPTWYPAVLCEGAFLMFPEQENAMRDPGYRERYAAGIVEGLERFFVEVGAR